MSTKQCSVLCGKLGFQTLKLRPDGAKLEERLKIPEKPTSKEGKKGKKELTKMKEKVKEMYNMDQEVKEKYNMGQGIVTSSILEVVDTLMKRDIPQIFQWKGKEIIPPVFVPDGFVPKHPEIIDPKNCEILQAKLYSPSTTIKMYLCSKMNSLCWLVS